MVCYVKKYLDYTSFFCKTRSLGSVAFEMRRAA